MYYKDIIVECPNKDFIKICNNNMILINDDTLLVFQMNDEVKDFIERELKDKVNGISIIHILIEEGLNKYKSSLKNLIEYIIFEQQNNIVNDQLFIVNEDQNFHNAALDIINETKRKISKNNGEYFPTEESATLGDLKTFHFSFAGNDKLHSYYGEMKLDKETYYVDLKEEDEVLEDVLYEYEVTILTSSLNNNDSENNKIIEEITDLDLIKNTLGKFTKRNLVAKGYHDVIVREKWNKYIYTMNCKVFAGKNMGIIGVATEADNFDIIITKIINPKYDKIIPDLI